MANLYALENGVLIPYTLSTQQQLLTSTRNSALPSAAQFSAELNRTEPTQTGQVYADTDSVKTPETPPTQNSTVEQQQSSGFPQQLLNLLNQQQQAPKNEPTNEADAWKQLYLQSMAELEKQRQVNATMQVEMAKQAIIGQKNDTSAEDLESALNTFFGYTE